MREAIEHSLAENAARQDRVAAALRVLGSLSDEEAQDLDDSIARLNRRVGGPFAGQSAKVLELRHGVRELETRLEAHLGTAPGSAGCCRNIDRAKAKAEVLDYFARRAERESAGPVYPSDCAAALNLDLLLVTELCDELATEGLLQ